MKQRTRLILFDIDGTLLDSGGAGTRSLDNAFSDIYSIGNAFKGSSMAGRTDIEIIRAALERHKIPSDDGAIPAITASYLRHLKSEITSCKGHVKPGTRELLDLLRTIGGVELGLLTGNIEDGAWMKLKHYGMDGYFTFGAFGSDEEDRNKLLPIAVGKYQELSGTSVEFADCVIVGDTPKDVDCALPYGAMSIAVATGKYSAAQLREAGAHMVLENLCDHRYIIGLISS